MNKPQQLLVNTIIGAKLLFGGYKVNGKKYVYIIYYNVFDNTYDIYRDSCVDEYITSRTTLKDSVRFVHSRN